MTDPVREKLLAEMQKVFAAEVGPGGTSFHNVLDSRYTGREFTGKNILSILEGPEVYSDRVSPNKRHRDLEIELDAWAYVPMKTQLRTGALTVLADLEYVCEKFRHWNGYATGTHFISNTIERSDTKDRTVNVTLFITVGYRTERNDPYTGVGIHPPGP